MFLVKLGVELIMKLTVTSDTDLSMNPSSGYESIGYPYQDTIILLTSYSQEYMNLSLHFFRKNMLHVSLLLCNRALESILSALYLKQERRYLNSSILLDDILRMISKGSEMNMESLIFIQSLSFLSGESSIISKMQPTHLMKMIQKADEILLRISSLLELPQASYHSVLKNRTL